jgi:cation transport ATPase
VLLADDLTKLTDAIKIGKGTTKIAKQSIYVGLGVSIRLMLIAAISGDIPSAVGTVLQETLDITVILNALRVR